MPPRQQQSPPRFFHEHGHGPARLSAALARLDWTRDDALDRARRLIATGADVGLALLHEVARQRRQPVARLVAGLVDRGDPDELPLLWLVLQRAAADGQPVGLSPERHARLDAAAAPMRSHARLLLTGDLPAGRLGDLAPVSADARLDLQLRQLAAAGALSRPEALARLLRTAAGESRGLATRLRHLRQRLAGFAPAHARLDYTGFRALPAPLRQALLFTPGLAGAFLGDAAQAAARPPSPDFDPLFFDRALADLASGRLDHLDVDTLVLGAGASPMFRARIVQSLANGVGSLDCADAVRERLIAASEVPEICLVACAVARDRHDMRRALARLPALPDGGVLGEALHRFAQIARDPDDSGIPA